MHLTRDGKFYYDKKRLTLFHLSQCKSEVTALDWKDLLLCKSLLV